MVSMHTLKSMSIRYVAVLALCVLLAGCGGSDQANSVCLSNCASGPGVQGVHVFVEPDAGEQPIVDAIAAARQSIYLEIYLLTDRKAIRALEEAAHRGVDVRVMLEMHPYGASSTAASETLDRLRAAGVQVQTSSPAFALTHEKGMVIDNSTAFIMTSNFTLSALGAGHSTKNREYDIVDTNPQDVQAIIAIFQADWNRTSAQFDDPNLVVSPINARNDFMSLINSAHNTLLIEAEEMQDSAIERALINAAGRGVRVQVLLPAVSSSSGDSNSEGISTITQGGIQVKEDPRLYMHAKIIVVDGAKAFVGSENISAASLDQNRELGIIVSDQSVLNTLEQTFQQDWQDSQSV